MRAILFRGKLKDNGDWIYWDMLAHITTHTGKISKYTQKTNYGEKYYHYAYQLWDRIDHSTIGQYTGLKDKNGKRIFEGDIVRILGDQENENWKHVDYTALIAFVDGGFCALDGTIEDHGFRRYGLSRMDFNNDVYYDCSACRESFCFIEGVPEENFYSYCPNCGADMRVDEEEKLESHSKEDGE